RDRQNFRLDTGLLCRHLVAWIFSSHSGYDFSLPQAGERAMANYACSHVFRLGFFLRPVCLPLACAVSRRPAVCLVSITIFFRNGPTGASRQKILGACVSSSPAFLLAGAVLVISLD